MELQHMCEKHSGNLYSSDFTVKRKDPLGGILQRSWISIKTMIERLDCGLNLQMTGS